MEILVALFGLGGMAAAALALVWVLSMVAKSDPSRKKIYTPAERPEEVRAREQAARAREQAAAEARAREEREAMAEAGLDLLSVLPPLPEKDAGDRRRALEEAPPRREPPRQREGGPR